MTIKGHPTMPKPCHGKNLREQKVTETGGGLKMKEINTCHLLLSGIDEKRASSTANVWPFLRRENARDQGEKNKIKGEGTAARWVHFENGPQGDCAVDMGFLLVFLFNRQHFC